MEEGEYKNTYNEITRIPCAFEKSLTNNKYKCSMSDHFCLADREGYACVSKDASENCHKILEVLRDKSRFLLKLNTNEQKLPHNKEIRVQVGGVAGIQNTLELENETNAPNDIYRILDAAINKYGDIQKFPYSDIVQSVASYQVRKRSSKT